MDLLSKSRKINAMLQKSAGKPVNFKEMAETLSEVIDSNVFVVSRRGKFSVMLSISKLKMNG